MIKIIVMYENKTTETFVGESFQHGDKALSISMRQGGYLAIPIVNVLAYQVQRVQEEDQAPQPYDEAEVIGSDEIEGSAEQEEGNTKKEEA